MKQILTILVVTVALFAGGCATKKYVQNTTAPVQAKVDQVAEQANKQGTSIAENEKQIKDVDEKAQGGISAAKERAMTAENKAGEAMNKATEAGNKAGEAQTLAQKNTQELGSLRQVVSNLDDYKLQGEVTIPFKFNKFALSDDAKKQLDSLVAEKGKFKRYFIAVEGFADNRGSTDYNAALSQKRADSVVHYLVAKHDIPIYRIHMVGLGTDKPVDEGKSRASRAKNRRVEVKIYSADQNVGALSQLQ